MSNKQRGGLGEAAIAVECRDEGKIVASYRMRKQGCAIPD